MTIFWKLIENISVWRFSLTCAWALIDGNECELMARGKVFSENLLNDGWETAHDH